MGEEFALPNRTGPGGRAFSSWFDRIALVSLAAAGVYFAPGAASAMEPWLGGWSLAATGCGLAVVVPMVATTLGKMYVRARA